MKTKIIIVLGVAAMLFTSCEGYLDKNPLDAISSETFWNTEADAEMGLAGVYSTLLNRSTYEIERGGQRGGFVSGVISPSTVPVSAAGWLFISGLLGLIGFSRCKQD